MSRWQQEVEGKEFNDVLDLGKYGDRVIGIGEFEKISSPWLTKAQSENWLPDGVDFSAFSVEATWMAGNQITCNISMNCRKESLRQKRLAKRISSSPNETELPLDAAKTFSKNWEKQQNIAHDLKSNVVEKAARAVLKIEQNIEEAVYIKLRRDSLLNARHAEPEIPLSLKEHIRLKDHQREGVACSNSFSFVRLRKLQVACSRMIWGWGKRCRS